MTDDQPDVRPEDALQVAQRALAKANELPDVQDQVDDLEDKVTALELRLSEIDEERDYASLTLDEKIGKVREFAFNKATDGHGRTTLDYDDIMWGVFSGEPGTKHCYKLMRLAAGRDGAGQQEMGDGMLGFAVRDPSDGNRHLAVVAERAKRNTVLFPENKTSAKGGR